MTKEMDRFLGSIEFGPRILATSCWDWTRCLDRDGYAVLTVNARSARTQRWAYTQKYGPIPAGLIIDHLCRNRKCVNPDHMEAVTNKENLLRGVGFAAVNARKTHCPSGHHYDSKNTRRRPTGRRACRICKAASDKRRKRSGRGRAE